MLMDKVLSLLRSENMIFIALFLAVVCVIIVLDDKGDYVDLMDARLIYTPDQDHPGWEIIHPDGFFTFQNFLDSIIKDTEKAGCVYVYGLDSAPRHFYSLTYEHGQITWVVDDILNQLGNEYIINGGSRHGDDYHVEVRRMPM